MDIVSLLKTWLANLKSTLRYAKKPLIEQNNKAESEPIYNLWWTHLMVRNICSDGFTCHRWEKPCDWFDTCSLDPSGINSASNNSTNLTFYSKIYVGMWFLEQISSIYYTQCPWTPFVSMKMCPCGWIISFLVHHWDEQRASKMFVGPHSNNHTTRFTSYSWK